MTRIALPKSRPGWPTSVPILHRRGLLPFWLASALPMSKWQALALPFRAAGACGLRLLRHCSASPMCLLLDEPTNYLDFEGTIWLKTFLKAYPHTIVLISHDRDLLNEVVTCIVHVDQTKLTMYQGNYDTFDRQRREKQALKVKLRKKQQDQRDHMQAYVDRFRYKASKARQAQSRLKALAKLEPIADLVDDRVVPFRFPSPEKSSGTTAGQHGQGGCGL